jgi:hypothetical protein
MSKLVLNQIYLQLEREIKQLSQSTIVTYRSAIKEDAQHVISELKSDIEKWIFHLNERNISSYDLENLLESKRGYIKLVKLELIGVEPEQLEIFKNDILRMIAKSILETYLNSLFRNPSILTSKSLKKEHWF